MFDHFELYFVLIMFLIDAILQDSFLFYTLQFLFIPVAIKFIKSYSYDLLTNLHKLLFISRIHSVIQSYFKSIILILKSFNSEVLFLLYLSKFFILNREQDFLNFELLNPFHSFMHQT